MSRTRCGRFPTLRWLRMVPLLLLHLVITYYPSRVWKPETSISVNRTTKATTAVSITREIPGAGITYPLWTAKPKLGFDYPAQVHQIAQRNAEAGHACHHSQAMGPQSGILDHHHHLVEECRDRFGQTTHGGSKPGPRRRLVGQGSLDPNQHLQQRQISRGAARVVRAPATRSHCGRVPRCRYGPSRRSRVAGGCTSRTRCP